MKQPIGVFDSGLGGLTVLSAIHELLPHEDLIYFGDTARVPYGNKSRETVIRYSLEILDFLLQKNVKAVVVACNTASAQALETLKEKSPVPVLGVVEPGVKALLKNYPSIKKAAVIATRSTVKSRAYQQSLKQKKADLDVIEKACPLLVPLVEEGYSDHAVTRLILQEYLQELVEQGFEHVILGCTHYPLLKKAIREIYPKLKLIDAAQEVARELREFLEATNLISNKNELGTIRLYVSDITESIAELEKLFFGKTIRSLEKVVLGL
ncbi:MAG: glutamate racemase [Leptospiraceae bacterium]|nr:glutamate racemase [Leptospiraceae bacterium]MDW8307246.1 glutamate racemase [Leptospiraceae bacterium]